MRKIVKTLLFATMLITVNATAQDIDPKIKEVYGESESQALRNNPDRLERLTDLLNNRIKILEVPVEGKEKCPKLSQMELITRYNSNLTRDVVFDPATFNPLKYNLNFFSTTSNVVYRVDNTNYLIVIEPQSTQKK